MLSSKRLISHHCLSTDRWRKVSDFSTKGDVSIFFHEQPGSFFCHYVASYS